MIPFNPTCTEYILFNIYTIGHVSNTSADSLFRCFDFKPVRSMSTLVMDPKPEATNAETI